ncbi:hypothetical protein ACFPA8_05950 [Streptomyces ovatisporus]|uniref:Phosphodiesterase n=1 Tax=Streptomyces ovatisporus TaxID=1128682 RepID=A0ABV9A398_9ACTN
MQFEGVIAGIGTGSGTRLVLGHWSRSPFGAFSDVMLERADGRRTLLAPTRRTADFVAATYTFDHVRVVPVTVRSSGRQWDVQAADLRMCFTLGGRGPLGLLLHAVPRALAAHPAWITLVDVPARVLPGVRTRGSAGRGRREWYGVHDLRPVTAASASLAGDDLGPLAPVDPPVRFGFASVPRRPSLARVTTTVELAAHE